MLGFVLLGVGSGSTGIGDALQNAFNFGSSGGTSISSLQSKVAKNPGSAADWRALATAYEQKQRTADAVTALERLSALQPKNTNTLSELASQYSQLATTYSNDYTNAQALAQTANPGAAFLPPSSTPLGKAFQSTSALADPISTAAATLAQSRVAAAYSKMQSVAVKAESAYEKLAAGSPDDATLQIQLGEAAQNAGDTATALKAYKHFLKLAPTDPLASQVKRVVKALEQAAASSQTGGQGSG